ncbi:hypothetical protein RJD38_14900 [Vibrio scophthalmi]|uniref:hypothetical protein n=1 Tax=Vibrio scophthalmi TaxID=45658 RepID=UPI00349F4460
MELTTIAFSIPTSIIDALCDLFVLWFCIGSLVFMPWSIYRSQNRNKEYQYMASMRGLLIILSVILLWPLMLRIMMKKGR